MGRLLWWRMLRLRLLLGKSLFTAKTPSSQRFRCGFGIIHHGGHGEHREIDGHLRTLCLFCVVSWV